MSDGASSSLFFGAFSSKLGVLFAAALAAFGCTAAAASDDVDTSEAALGESATITFDGAWNETAAGDLRKGKKVRIVYDAARLPACRGDFNGAPGWAITGFWRIGDGPIRTFPAGGLSPSGSAESSLSLDVSGDLQIWFQNTSRWGCSAYDSNLGDNYHFAVAPAEHEPGWMGNVRYAIDRMTCNGICDASLKPVSGEISDDMWARQRAAVRALTFEVWKDGVTNWDNPEQWKQLDVQVHARVGSTGAFKTSWVSFERRIGNNARYAIDLRSLDPIPGLFTIQDPSDCPAFELTATAHSNGAYVEAVVELYVTVNGAELRPAGAGSAFRVRYANYKGLYAPCVN
jgi:hypothetical protein